MVFYALFLRAGTSYYKSTSSLIEYINGFSSFVEGGARFMAGKINISDLLKAILKNDINVEKKA